MFEYVQDAVEGSAVGYFDGTAVFRELVCYELVLFLCYFHMIIVSHQCNLGEHALEQRWGENPPESLLSDDVVPILVRPGYVDQEVLDDVVGQLEHLAGLFQEIYAPDAPDAAGE